MSICQLPSHRSDWLPEEAVPRGPLMLLDGRSELIGRRPLCRTIWASQHESRAAFESRLLGLESHKGRLFTVLDGLEEAGLRAGTSALLSVCGSQEEETGTTKVHGRPKQQPGCSALGGP